MTSWNRWLRLFPQPVVNLLQPKKLYSNKRRLLVIEGLEERITPVTPSVLSIVRQTGTLASTTASYTVSFSETVTGVDSSDFNTTSSGDVNSTSITVAGSGSAYTVTISGITGNGTISLNLIDNDTIKNSVSQPLGGTNLLGISFSAKTDFSTGASSGPHAITTDLINADSFTDIISVNRYNNKTSVLLAVGDGTFNTQTSFTTGVEPQGVSTADINGDGKVDLVTANSFDGTGGNTISVLLGNGNNTFITKPVVSTQSAPLSVTIGDFNADSKLDIATANYGSNSVSILLGNSNGTFIAATNFSTGGGPKSIAIGDVNGDGFLDLATANFSGSLSLLIGNGDGSFKASTSLSAGTRPFAVIMADINGDGKKDLISANYGSNNVCILLGNGNGTFKTSTSATVGTKPVSVAAADLDGDGKIDLAVANRVSNSISLIAGNGDGTFKTAINFDTGATPYSVTIADFNGDSNPDIATANEGSDNISVFLNTTNNPSNFAGQTYTVANIPPGITISSDKSALKSGETATITFTLSELSANFTYADIVSAGGTLGTLSGSGSSYTAFFTPTTNSSTPATFNVPANTFTDAAGNSNTAATQLSITVDTIPPGITISSDKSALKSGETAFITFTLSEPSANFSFADIVSAGGTLGTLSGSGSSYTANFTPTTNSSTPATFNVASGTFTDAAGNNNIASTQLSITVDTIPPSITISSDKAALRSGETAAITFTLSEPSANFTYADIISAGGTLGALSGSGSSYTAIFTPTTSSTTPATFNVASNTFTDAAGNNNTAATQLSITVDTIPPGITISSDKSALKSSETATITFTLSEPSANFSFADIVSVGGMLGTLSGSGSSYTAIFTPTANSTTAATFNVAANTFTDNAGNNNTPATQLSISVDTIPPGITISSDKAALISGETATITFTLSEPSANFTYADIVSAGGTLGTLSNSGLIYTATFTSTANSTTAATFNVAANTFTDAAGNNNTAAIQLSITVDTIPPSITISSDKAALRSGETATITFTLSEPSANFNDADIVSAGGTLGTLSGSGSSYTAIFTPTTNSSTPATFNIASGTFTDAAGNNNIASTQLSITVDTIPPSITISSDKAALKSGETEVITFTLSEPSANFNDADIVSAGGTLGTLSGSGSSYTAIFTPTANSTTAATFNVAAATFADTAGNSNTAATQLSITVDTIPPGITISSDKAALKSGETATITFTLSEPSANFSFADIVSAGGTLGTFSGSGSSYTAFFTPTTNSSTPATFNVASGTFTDAAGNSNIAATQLSITVDTIPPSITISSDKAALKSGETATITFTLSEPFANFTYADIVSAGGTLGTFSGSGSSYTANFTPTTNSSTPATFNVPANTFTDAAGNNNTSASQLSITVDTIPPSIAISSDKAALKSGETATITFTLSEPSSTFAISDVTSTGGVLSNFSGSGLTYTANFTPTTNSSTPATFYVAANTFTDGAGNNNTASTQLSITVDTIPPGIAISSDKSALKSGETATITFTLSEPSANFTYADIVSAGGTLGALSGSGSSYTAIFTPTTNSTTAATFNVATGTFTDNAGNSNTAATQLSIIVDTTLKTPTPNPTPNPTPTLTPNPTPTPTLTPNPLIMGTQAPTVQGASSTVTLYDPFTGQPSGTAVPFPGFSGPIQIVSGDYDNDGVMDIIASAGFGGGPVIAILNSQTGAIMEAFFAFDPAFTGGVFVAVNDVNNDGILDIIAAAGPSGGPEIRIFDGKNLTVLKSFFAYSEDFRGGVNVAIIDFNDDGILDLVTGAGPGGAPHVKVFDGATNAILSQWYAYPVSFTGGVFVAAGDIGNNGLVELVTGAGPGGTPVVAVWDPFSGALLSQFYAYAEYFNGGVKVHVNDGNNDEFADLITEAGPNGMQLIKGFNFPNLDLIFSFFNGAPTQANYF